MTKERACANAHTLSRRTLLSALPVAGLGVSAPAVAQDEDPIMPIYREWWASRLAWNALVELDLSWESQEVKAAEARENAAFLAIIEITPVSLEGIAAMAHVMFQDFGPQTRRDLSEQYLEESEWPQNKMMAAIWRGASGKTGLPPHYSEFTEQST